MNTRYAVAIKHNMNISNNIIPPSKIATVSRHLRIDAVVLGRSIHGILSEKKTSATMALYGSEGRVRSWHTTEAVAVSETAGYGRRSLITRNASAALWLSKYLS
jgi:hypothetical protein